MAVLGVDRKAGSLVALLLLLLSIGLIAFGLATGTKIGGKLYLVVLATIIVGMSLKEDSVAVGGVMALSLLVILDIHKHIGLLG